VPHHLSDVKRRVARENRIKRGWRLANDVLAAVRHPFLVLDDAPIVKKASQTFYDKFRVLPENKEGVHDGSWIASAVLGADAILVVL
jgi:hypothetical protein